MSVEDSVVAYIREGARISIERAMRGDNSSNNNTINTIVIELLNSCDESRSEIETSSFSRVFHKRKGTLLG